MNIKLDIPACFFEGEERCGYYVSPEMKKVWAVELDLLSEFARVCSKHNLKWWICYGTLLGAVRHKGFIPWDDDVDVVMMHSDYEKLCQLSEDEFKHPYRLRFYENEPDRMMDIGKLQNEDTTMFEGGAVQLIKQGRAVNYSQGMWIDVFPLHDVPDDKKLFMKIFRKAVFFKLSAKFAHAMEYNLTPTARWKRFLKLVMHPIVKAFNLNMPYKKLFSKYVETVKSCVWPGSKMVVDFWPIDSSVKGVWGFLHRLPTSREYFDETVYLPFEMLSLPAPAGYERMLTQYYGDWQTPVIVKSHSPFFDADRSYKYYLENGLSPDVEI